MNKLAISLSSLLSLSAHATEPFETYKLGNLVPQGMYAHAAISKTIRSQWCDDIPANVSCNGKPPAFVGGLGFAVLPYVDAEVGYMTMRDATASAGTVAVTAGVDAWLLSGVMHVPISPAFSAYVRAGAARWSVDAKALVSGQTVLQEDSRGWSQVTGIGAKVSITSAIMVRLEYQFIPSVGEEDETGGSDLHMLSLGAEFRF